MSATVLSSEARAVLGYALANSPASPLDGQRRVAWVWSQVREACGLFPWDDADPYGDRAWSEVLRPALDELYAAGLLVHLDEDQRPHGHASAIVFGNVPAL